MLNWVYLYFKRSGKGGKKEMRVKQHGCEFGNLELARGKISLWTHFFSIRGHYINWLSRLTISNFFCGAQVNGVGRVSQIGNCCLVIMWFFKFSTEKCGEKRLLKAKHFLEHIFKLRLFLSSVEK